MLELAKQGFLKFLRTSLENRLTLTTVQIKLLEPNITETQIEEAIAKAEWQILEQSTKNEVTTYKLIDPCFICSCGAEQDHWHGDQACCGGNDCCPEAYSPDVNVQIAEKVVGIRQMLKQRGKSVNAI